MKILLVYPPSSYVDMPPLGIACLKSCLEAKPGIQVRTWDWNLDFIDAMLTPELIRKKQLFHSTTDYFEPNRFNKVMASMRQYFEALSSKDADFLYEFSANGFYMKHKRISESSTLDDIFDILDQSELSVLKNQLTPIFDKASHVDLLGISCGNPQQLIPSLYLARRFKHMGLANKIVLGGSYITSIRSTLLISKSRVFDFVDYVIPYEAEESMVELVNYLQGNTGIENVPALSYLAAPETIQSNKPKKIADLNSLPTPDFSGFDLASYWTPEPVLPVYSSRGCYFDRCKFCNHHENYYGNFRVKSVNHVLRDLSLYEKHYGATKYFFVDELISPKMLIQLSDAIVNAKLNSRWYAHCRLDPTIEVDGFKKMADGGLTLLHVGIESANTRILELMDKGYDRKAVEVFLDKMAHVPITGHYNLIRGYPGETVEEYTESLQILHDRVKAGDYVHLYKFDLIRNSPLQLSGSPDIAKQYPEMGVLGQSVPFDLKNPDETPLDLQSIRMSRRLSGAILKTNEVYPDDFNWAAHLLYVDHMRDRGNAALLDQPLADTHVHEPRFHSIKMDNERSIAFFPRSKQIVPVSHELAEQMEASADRRISYLIDDFNIIDSKNAETKQGAVVYLNVSTGCNLHCTYCYADEGKYGGNEKSMTFQTATETIRRFAGMPDGISTIIFFGGEPLLQLQLIEKVVAWTIDFYEKMPGKKPFFSIITNGTLITDTAAKFLAAHSFSVTLSLDGPQAIHDFLRPDAKMNPSYANVVAGLSKLQQNGITPGIEATFTKKHLEMGIHPVDMVKFFRETWGIRSLALSPMSGETDDPLKMSGFDFAKEIREAIRYSFQTLSTDKPITLQLSQVIGNFLKTNKPRAKEQFCYARMGNSTYAVSASGDVYPCQMFNGHEEFRMGNISKDLTVQEPFHFVRERFENNTKEKSPCNACWAKEVCFLCLAGVYLETGNIEDIPEHRCHVAKECAEEVILFQGKKE